MSYNVLVTDDNAVNRSLIIQILHGAIENTVFFEAADGEECLKIMRTQDIDLNILDLLMPKMDGFEVIRRMKSDGKLCDIPIIINSAVEDIPSIQKILTDGANDYFSKPLMPDEIKIFLPLKVKNALFRYAQYKKIKIINERNLQELRIASSLQCSMMAGYKMFGKTEMYGGYVPSNEIGGDFYDCVERKGKLWFLIADVSGHGIAAAMVSIMLKGMFGDMIPDTPEPNILLKRLNQKFIEILGGFNSYLVSAFAGCIDGGTLCYANAGHPYPIVYYPYSGQSKVLNQNGFLLGAFEKADFQLQKIFLKKDDWLITYTDGIFEKKYGNRKIAFHDLLDEISCQAKKCGNSPKDLIHRFIHNAGDNEDDVSMMVIRKL